MNYVRTAMLLAGLTALLVVGGGARDADGSLGPTLTASADHSRGRDDPSDSYQCPVPGKAG